MDFLPETIIYIFPIVATSMGNVSERIRNQLRVFSYIVPVNVHRVKNDMQEEQLVLEKPAA